MKQLVLNHRENLVSHSLVMSLILNSNFPIYYIRTVTNEIRHNLKEMRETPNH